jgi:cobalt/nickel transport system permease protein
MTPAGIPSHQATAWISRRDARLRLLATLAFALVVLSLKTLSSLMLALTLAATLAAASGLSARTLILRLAALEGLMLVLLLSLPFSVPGHSLLHLGPLSASAEGLHLALGILLRASSILLVLLALVGTLEPVVFGHALARLGVPEKLVHLLLMTVRQIHLIQEESLRLRQAMRARAFVPRSDLHTWRSYAWLIGMLLVRSLTRAQRILQAMRCRGFQGRLYLLDATVWTRGDSIAALGLMLPLTALPLLDRFLR